MLKAFIRIAAVTFVFAFSLASHAQNIAVVNIQAAILESAYAKSEIAKLEANPSFSSIANEYQTLVADIQALDADANANNQNWSQEQLADYNKQRQFLAADLNLNQEKLQREQSVLLEQIELAMNEPVRTALGQLIEEEGITMLLRDTAVYQATPLHDITLKLIEKLNQ